MTAAKPAASPVEPTIYVYTPVTRSSFMPNELFGVGLAPMTPAAFEGLRRSPIGRSSIAFGEAQAVEHVVAEIRERLRLDDLPSDRELLTPSWIKHSAVLKHLRAAVASGGPLVQHQDVRDAIEEGFKVTGPVVERAEHKARLDAAAAAAAPIAPRAQR